MLIGKRPQAIVGATAGVCLVCSNKLPVGLLEEAKGAQEGETETNDEHWQLETEEIPGSVRQSVGVTVRLQTAAGNGTNDVDFCC